MSELTEQEPFWIKRDYLERRWTEDDATVGMPDHESLSSALKRLGLRDRSVVAEWDAGDAQYSLLLGGVVTCSSYPGNSGIWELNEAGKLAWKVDRMVGYGKVGGR